jgi:iron complex transport system substrate-binding protein
VLNPDIETILALEPDLVINIPGNASGDAVARLAALGVPTLVVSTATVEEALDAIGILGERTGRPDEAAALVQKIRSGFADVRSRVASVPRTKTLFVIGHNPLYAVGGNTFIHDLIEISGGINIASGALGPYPRIGLEEVIAGAPEVIIDSTLGTAFPEKDIAVRRQWWQQWDAIPAVAAGRVYGLDTDVLLRPGSRMAEAARIIAGAIHPDVFDGDSGT